MLEANCDSLTTSAWRAGSAPVPTSVPGKDEYPHVFLDAGSRINALVATAKIVRNYDRPSNCRWSTRFRPICTGLIVVTTSRVPPGPAEEIALPLIHAPPWPNGS